jgi:hypothetical protein
MQRAEKLMYHFAAHTVTAPLRHALTAVAGARRLSRERILMLGRTPLAERIMREADSRAGVCGSIVGVVDDLPRVDGDATGPPLLGPIGRLSQIVDRVHPDRIVVALTERRGSTPIQALLESCLVRGIVIEEAAQYYERLTGQLAIESLTPTSIVFSGKFPPSAVHEAVARVVSLLVAVAGLVCSLPLMADRDRHQARIDWSGAVRAAAGRRQRTALRADEVPDDARHPGAAFGVGGRQRSPRHPGGEVASHLAPRRAAAVHQHPAR